MTTQGEPGFVSVDEHVKLRKTKNARIAEVDVRAEILRRLRACHHELWRLESMADAFRGSP